MNTETDALKSIAEEIVARAKETNEVMTKPDTYLVNEVSRLKRAIANNLCSLENFTQRDTYHYNTLSKLINIADLLYDVTGSVNPNVMLLMDLLDTVRQIVPAELRPNLKLSKAFVALRQEQLRESWLHHSSLMASYEVPEKLIIIAGIPFKRFTEDKRRLTWGDYTWLKLYISKLEILDWENGDCNSPAEALISLLIGRDFNDDRFFIYCKRYITERVSQISGKRNRVLEYAQCEKLVLEDTQLDVQPFDLRANSVSARLVKWIHEEIDFVETHEKEKPWAKFPFAWSAEMIAVFFKLLHDRKIFGSITLERLSEVVAANCSSAEKAEIQSSTIHSRFYKKDIELLKAVRKIVKDMLDDLDNMLS